MLTEKGNDDLLTVAQLADWLQWSEWSVYNSLDRLNIPHVRLGASIRFRVGAIREWLQSREQASA